VARSYDKGNAISDTIKGGLNPAWLSICYPPDSDSAIYM
jgi:hypothetical protein